jgi:serine/threonine protein kinase
VFFFVELKYSQMMKREIAIMKKLDHKHVVKLTEVIEDQQAQEIFLGS